MSTKKIIRQIAKEHGVTPQEVERDMREAIRQAMASTDPQAQAFWKQVAPDGKEPDIGTFLKICANKVHSEMIMN